MPGPMGGRGRGPMPKEKMNIPALKKMLLYCKRYLPAIAAAVLLAVGGTCCTIIGPDKISDLTNVIAGGIMTGIDIKALEKCCFTLVAIYGTGAVLGYGQQFITATVTQYTSKRLRRDINEKINRLPLNYFDTSTKGDILSRVTNDVDTISQTLSSNFANMMAAVVQFFGVLIMMIKSNLLLSVVTILCSLLGFVFMSTILKHSQKYFDRKQQYLGDMNGRIEEVYTNYAIVRAFGAEEQECRGFSEVNDKLYETNWKSQMLSGMMHPVMGFVGNLSYALIFIIGVAFIIGGSSAVSFGTIMAFVMYSKLFSSPLSNLAQSMTGLQQASAASKRVFDILDAVEMPDESGKTAVPTEVRGNVEFRNVRFGYTPDRTIIHNFSASLKAGQKVAIVGPTGAGKTTMVNLLMRFYDIAEGDILIDGISTKDMRRETVHDLFDMILQDTWLFGGTIRENLVYNQTGVTEADLDRVCEAVGLKHFIETLPDGYDTVLSDALSLSEGQKQQLTIARAMVKESPLLILDEATSSVDTRTELVIQRAMDDLTEGRTSFVIAHRLSTIRDADVILVMRDGDIVEQGTHAELLRRNGFYAELYNAQFAAG